MMYRKHIKSLYNNILSIISRDNLRIVFVHIAKCGGVSTDLALKRNFLLRAKRITSYESLEAAKTIFNFDNAFDDDYHNVLFYRDYLLRYFLENKNVNYISGHFGFSKKLYEEYKDRFVFVTMLRNPVDRFLSHYFFNHSKEINSPWKINLSLDQYINTAYANNIGHDYVKLIGGLRRDQDYNSENAIMQAIESLAMFKVLGILENVEAFELQVKKALGIKIKLQKTNISPVKKEKRRKQVNKTILEKIEKICEPDLKVYNAAEKMIKNWPL